MSPAAVLPSLSQNMLLDGSLEVVFTSSINEYKKFWTKEELEDHDCVALLAFKFAVRASNGKMTFIYGHIVTEMLL